LKTFKLGIYAISQADFVIIPTQGSQLDANEAGKDYLIHRGRGCATSRHDLNHAISAVFVVAHFLDQSNPVGKTWVYNGIRRDLISGAPDWVGKARYDIDAKFDDTLVQELNKLPREQLSAQYESALQSLLADRFKLLVGRPIKILSIYTLVIAKGGPRLKAATPGDTYANGIKRPDGSPRGPGVMMTGPGQITGQGIPITNLVEGLSQQFARTILDRTGLKGTYDIALKWTPGQTQLAMFNGPDSDPGPVSAPAPDVSGLSLFTAIEEQLGLKIASTKGPTKTLVIEQIEKPSEN
jgi:bla regulator protein blaR1